MKFISCLGLLSALLALMLVNAVVSAVCNEDNEYCVRPSKACLGSCIGSSPKLTLSMCKGRCRKLSACTNFNYDAENQICYLKKEACNEKELIDDAFLTNYHKKLIGETCAEVIEWCVWEGSRCAVHDKRKSLGRIWSGYVANRDLCRKKCESDVTCKQYLFTEDQWNCQLKSDKCGEPIEDAPTSWIISHKRNPHDLACRSIYDRKPVEE